VKKISILFSILVSLLVFASGPALADGIPSLPHAFYGDLTINGSPAPPGTIVEARGTGVTTGIEGNPIVTAQSGSYGAADPLAAKLIAQGDILDGAAVSFYVNGVLATSVPAVVEWHSGSTTQIDLSATIEEEEELLITITLFGCKGEFPISETGEVLRTIIGTSEDGDLTATIPAGTIALDKYGDPLTRLSVSEEDSPPPPPEEASIIGLAYDFRPNGATFRPPITLKYSYDPVDIPEGVGEEDLVIAYYDEDGDEWVELECTVNTAANTITASVSHFTAFAIIAQPEELEPAEFSLSNLTIEPGQVLPGEAVTITITVTNIGDLEGDYDVELDIDGAGEDEEEVTLAGGQRQQVGFTVARTEPGSYNVSVDTLSGSFTVMEPALPPEPPAPQPKVETLISPTLPPTQEPTSLMPIVVGIASGVAGGMLAASHTKKASKKKDKVKEGTD